MLKAHLLKSFYFHVSKIKILSRNILNKLQIGIISLKFEFYFYIFTFVLDYFGLFTYSKIDPFFLNLYIRLDLGIILNFNISNIERVVIWDGILFLSLFKKGEKIEYKHNIFYINLKIKLK
jgi:hypothetical protein